MNKITDQDWTDMDNIVEALETHASNSTEGATPSAIARKAKVDRHRVYSLLNYLASNHHIRTSGNGYWMRFHAK